MSISIQAAIRTPKVNTGLAANEISLRRLDDDYTIAPDRSLASGIFHDDYGRIAPIDSVTSETSTMDPQYRMDVEQAVSRPNYSSYLNVPQGLWGISGGGNYNVSDYSNTSEKDTMGVQRYSSLGFAKTYKVVSAPRNIYSSQVPGEFIESEQRDRRMSRKNAGVYYANQ